LDLKSLQINQEPKILRQILHWLSIQPHAAILTGNSYTYPNQPFRNLMAAGKKSIELDSDWPQTIRQKNPDSWWFGYLGYDVKGTSANEQRPVFLQFPEWKFFEADVVFETNKNTLIIHADHPEKVSEEIQRLPEYTAKSFPKNPGFSAALSKTEYLKNVERVKQLIREGEVYELNLCQYFQANWTPDGLSFFEALNKKYPMPFSGWIRSGSEEIASASPERFLKRDGAELISQPIKGTARRGQTVEEDEQNRLALLNSEKERAENMMIVDLVRNDLAKVSKTGSTTVEEMFGIYAFPKVFQMISTVRSVLQNGLDTADALDSTFPMGSMTGAPKQEVMKRISALEPFRRGAYSGALGYFGPGTNFDFNVLIRSLFINHKIGESGFAVGSAITIDSEPEEEWEECRNKAAALLDVCGSSAGF